MKEIIASFAFVLVLSFHIIGQSPELEWTDPITVANGSNYDNVRPRIALTTNNIPIVMWGKLNPETVYSSKWNGTDFSTPISLSPTGIEPFVTIWAGPEIAAIDNKVFVTFKSTPVPEGFVYIVRSTDNGSSFSDTIRVENIGENVSRFPSVAVTPDGNPVVIFMKFLPGFLEPKYVVSNSADGGLTFNTDIDGSTLAPGEVCDCCPADIVVDGNKQFLLFRNNDNDLRDIWATVSNDGGSGFNIGDDIDQTNWVRNSCPATGPAGLLVGDSLITVWMSGSSGSSRIYISKSDIDNVKVGFHSILASDVPSNANQNYPKIAGNNDTIGVVWQSAVSGNIDCFLAVSTNGVNGLINNYINIAVITSKHQRNPDIAYSNGTFYMVFQDDNSGDVIYRTVSIIQPQTGLNHNLDLIDFVKISPNPFTQQTMVTFGNKSQKSLDISLFDVSGKRLRRYKNITDSKLIIERNELESGLYFIRIYNGKEIVYRSKIVIN